MNGNPNHKRESFAYQLRSPSLINLREVVIDLGHPLVGLAVSIDEVPRVELHSEDVLLGLVQQVLLQAEVLGAEDELVDVGEAGVPGHVLVVPEVVGLRLHLAVDDPAGGVARLPAHVDDVLVELGPDVAPLGLHLLLGLVDALEVELQLGGAARDLLRVAVVVEEELADAEAEVVVQPLAHVGHVLDQLEDHLDRQEVVLRGVLLYLVGFAVGTFDEDPDYGAVNFPESERLGLIVNEVVCFESLDQFALCILGLKFKGILADRNSEIYSLYNLLHLLVVEIANKNACSSRMNPFDLLNVGNLRHLAHLDFRFLYFSA